MARLLHESVFSEDLLIPSTTGIFSSLKNPFKILNSIFFFYALLIRHHCASKNQYSILFKGWRWLNWSLIQIKKWRFLISKLISQKHPSLMRPLKRSRRVTQTLKSSLLLVSINSRNFPLGGGLENYPKKFTLLSLPGVKSMPLPLPSRIFNTPLYKIH